MSLIQLVPLFFNSFCDRTVFATQPAEPEELWEPEGARFVNGELVIERDRSFYNGEEIIQPRFTRWTREEQLDLLDWHPLFTGRCPQCEHPFPRYERPPVHWDCECGWMDDTV